VWVVVDERGVRTDENVLSLGNSGRKDSAVVLKKKIQRGATRPSSILLFYPMKVAGSPRFQQWDERRIGVL